MNARANIFELTRRLAEALAGRGADNRRHFPEPHMRICHRNAAARLKQRQSIARDHGVSIGRA